MTRLLTKNDIKKLTKLVKLKGIKYGLVYESSYFPPDGRPPLSFDIYFDMPKVNHYICISGQSLSVNFDYNCEIEILDEATDYVIVQHGHIKYKDLFKRTFEVLDEFYEQTN